MKRTLIPTLLLFAALALCAEPQGEQTFSPYAPAQIIPASEKTASEKAAPAGGKFAARRAVPPRERRLKGEIPGIVTFDYGKTASGERTRLYRLQGQGGVIMDFTDYGARLIRCYVPDATGELSDLALETRKSVIDAEKAGERAQVWKMRTVRQPRATGLVFTRETTNAAPIEVSYWLDARNNFIMKSSFADVASVTNEATAAGFAALPCVFKFKADPARALKIEGLSTTTNGVTKVFTRAATNLQQSVQIRIRD